MAKLVDIHREEVGPLSMWQLPLKIDDKLIMVMDLSDWGFVGDTPKVTAKELEDFGRKLEILTTDEIKRTFEITRKDLLRIIRESTPCVGCRRGVESLCHQLIESGHMALDPLVFQPDGIMTVKEELMSSPELLCKLAGGHRIRLSDIVQSEARSKTSQRCNLHSMDFLRSSTQTRFAWKHVWNCMEARCREEVVLIECSTFQEFVRNYIDRHKFCSECRTKVLRAYKLLLEEPRARRMTGFVPALYSGIDICLPEKRIRLQTTTQYIEKLLTRADRELRMQSRGDMHAETMASAQEIVVTCLGLFFYEKLNRIHLRMHEEKRTCQLLTAIAKEALGRNFERAIESKQGMTKAECLLDEIAKEELAKAQRKEQKKRKKNKKKEKRAKQNEKDNNSECESKGNGDQMTEETVRSCSCVESQHSSKNSDRHVLNEKSNVSSTSAIKGSQHTKKEKGSSKTSKNKELYHSDELKSSSDKLQKASQSHSFKGKSAVSNSLCGSQSAGTTFSSSSHPAFMSPYHSDTSAHDLELYGGRSSALSHTWSTIEHSQGCGDTNKNTGYCDTVLGISSLPSSTDGSGIACSDELGNHGSECHGVRTAYKCSSPPSGLAKREEGKESNGLRTCEEKLEDESCSSDNQSFIPEEEVEEFKAKYANLTQEIKEHRQTLRRRFEQLCLRSRQRFS